ncbi:MAG TPA: PDZ domain-containing protein [Steroidobacteraceae bacterium]|nr:PDZ domain-containing protein [Steroidobacteraceae bacterium]
MSASDGDASLISRIALRSCGWSERWFPDAFAFAVVAIALGLSIDAAHAKDPALLSLGMEHFKGTATVQENPLDGTTAISTEKGFVEHTGPMRMVWNDEYLTGLIDKAGQKSFRVNAWIIYSGNLRSYETAHFRTASGWQSVPAIQIGKEVMNCAVGDCTYTERIAFAVDEELLRQLAAGRVPDKPVLWPFRVTAKSGPDYAGGLSNAEISGFLAKVDEYINAPPVTNSRAVVNANATTAALKVDLGVGGMPVDATAEQPNRAGILITGVTRGSVAHKAGIIIGDILYEFDGHPIKVPADLEAAVSGRAANSLVAIKLYRGTDVMTVSAQF